MQSDEISLAPSLAQSLQAQGHAECTPLQQRLIPALWESTDLLCAAPSGAERTIACAAALLHVLDSQPLVQSTAQSAPQERLCPRVLVLVAHRDRAAQVEEAFFALAKSAALPFFCVDLGAAAAKVAFTQADVVVVTGNRAVEALERGTLDLGQVQRVVVDDLDRVLEMGWQDSLHRVQAALPASAQVVAFVGRLGQEACAWAQSRLREPRLLDLSDVSTQPAMCGLRAHPVGRDRKRELLLRLLPGYASPVLVFARTRYVADALVSGLRRAGVEAVVAHGHKSPAAREAAARSLLEGKARVLIATDFWARGVQLGRCAVVVQYDTPISLTDFAWRASHLENGETPGTAVFLRSAEEQASLQTIEQALGCPVVVEELLGPPPREDDAAVQTDQPVLERPARRPQRPPRVAGATGGAAGILIIKESAPATQPKTGMRTKPKVRSSVPKPATKVREDIPRRNKEPRTQEPRSHLTAAELALLSPGRGGFSGPRFNKDNGQPDPMRTSVDIMRSRGGDMASMASYGAESRDPAELKHLDAVSRSMVRRKFR
ncbi:DEAD/DEAH box helicase [Candidatus Symbiobacter mobilis]|uniref:DNA/RNA SNF2 family helicase n=1 Tax=Candidatus Symbiobacter mobilis CR TaxID=946483 RepID=U5N5N3_9BURK|nr:DEAD/DEAH box helicase [Candidatus Symbiobacter mobilis]AGX86575.1 DNA/RNA SNF2 family helicase [Candidatus Symbiobacter mobilis CR]